MKTRTILKVISIVMVLCLVLGVQTSVSLAQPTSEERPSAEGGTPIDVGKEKPRPNDRPVGQANFDTFVPENVYVYLSIDDLDKWSGVIKKSFINKLWNDPEVQKFVEKASELIQKKFTEEVTKETQITLKDITSLSEVFRGQVAFILESVELKPTKKKVTKYFWDEEERESKSREIEVDSIEPIFNVVLLARVVGNKEKLEDLIDKISNSLTEEEIYKKKDDYKGVSYSTFYKKKESLKVSYGYIDDIFFLAYGERAFKRIIDHYKGEGKVKSLNTRFSYRKLVTEVGLGRLDTNFVNCPPIVSMLKQWFIKEAMSKRKSFTPEELDKTNKTVDKVLELTGLTDLKTIVSGSRLEGDGVLGYPGS